jgi:hypothetical protein
MSIFERFYENASQSGMGVTIATVKPPMDTLHEVLKPVLLTRPRADVRGHLFKLDGVAGTADRGGTI